MARGGKRKGAGRKTVAIESDVKAAINEALADDPGALKAIWQNVMRKAKAGSDRHAQLLFNYYYGKPKDNEGQPTEMIINVLRNS